MQDSSSDESSEINQDELAAAQIELTLLQFDSFCSKIKSFFVSSKFMKKERARQEAMPFVKEAKEWYLAVAMIDYMKPRLPHAFANFKLICEIAGKTHKYAKFIKPDIRKRTSIEASNIPTFPRGDDSQCNTGNRKSEIANSSSYTPPQEKIQEKIKIVEDNLSPLEDDREKLKNIIDNLSAEDIRRHFALIENSSK